MILGRSPNDVLIFSKEVKWIRIVDLLWYRMVENRVKVWATRIDVEVWVVFYMLSCEGWYTDGWKIAGGYIEDSYNCKTGMKKVKLIKIIEYELLS